MSKAILIDSREVERDYGFEGTEAIVDHPVHGRILITDGFGGIASVNGGAVRWTHGSAYKLPAAADFDWLDEEDDSPPFLTRQEALEYLDWTGHMVAALAKSLDL